MNKEEIIQSVRAFEKATFSRRIIEGCIVGFFLFTLVVLAYLEIKQYGWLIVGAMLMVLVIIEVVFNARNKHKVLCSSCGHDFILSVSTNYILLKNACHKCGKPVYEA